MSIIPLYKQELPVTYPIDYYITQFLNDKELSIEVKILIHKALILDVNIRQYLAKELAISYSSTKKITDSLFGACPTTVRFKTRILDLFNVKQCSKCHNLLEKSYFDSNASRPDKLQTLCKFCKSKWIRDNKAYYASLTSNRRNQKISKFFQKQLTDFYKNCPIGYEVDHIIPINNDAVCGLHVPWNLQYLSWKDNRCKSNKFDAR